MSFRTIVVRDDQDLQYASRTRTLIMTSPHSVEAVRLPGGGLRAERNSIRFTSSGRITLVVEFSPDRSASKSALVQHLISGFGETKEL